MATLRTGIQQGKRIVCFPKHLNTSGALENRVRRFWADAPLNRFVLLHSICSQHPECRAVTERLTAYQPHRSPTSTVVLTEPPSLAATVLSRSACDWAEVSLSLLPVIALWPELPVSIPKERGARCWPRLVVVTCSSSRTTARMYSVKVYSVFKVQVSGAKRSPHYLLDSFEINIEKKFEIRN